MKNNIFDNKYLKPNKDVVLGKPETSRLICLLDPYFGQKNVVAFVTSILRDPKKQLEIIISYAKKLNLPVNFTSDDVNKKENEYYVWQSTWSKLLNRGIIVSPPIPAICLEDYYVGKENRKGKLINASPHFTGYAFDISGNNLNKIVEVLEFSKENNNEIKKLMKKYLIEHNNNCVHVDVNST